jgi:hypothetical protein
MIINYISMVSLHDLSIFKLMLMEKLETLCKYNCNCIEIQYKLSNT